MAGNTTKMRFHDVDVELPSVPGIEFFSDGSLKLSFTNFTGSLVLRPTVADCPPLRAESPSSLVAPSFASITSPTVQPATAGDGAGSNSKSRGTPSTAKVDEKGKGRGAKRQQNEKGADVEENAMEVSGDGKIPAEDEADEEGGDSAVCMEGVDASDELEQVQPYQEEDLVVVGENNPVSDAEDDREEEAASQEDVDGDKGVLQDEAVAKDGEQEMRDTGEKEEEEEEEQQGSKVVSPAAASGRKGRKSAVRGSASPQHHKAKRARRGSNAAAPAAPAVPTSLLSASKIEVVGPQGRWGHTATMIAPGKMVVYGGEGDDEKNQSCTLGDVVVYDMEEEKWIVPTNCDSIPRAWHSTTFLPDKHLVVAFGGERNTPSGTPEVLDECMILDCELFLWYPPVISGRPPSARSGHSASLLGKDMIVFGGSRGRKWQNGITALDTERWHWRAPQVTGDAPAGRSYHSATVVGDSIVYFGGNDGVQCFNKVHVLRSHGNGAYCWFHPEVVGQGPERRTGHAATLVDRRYILIQGGWDPQDESKEETKMFNDAFLLDTEAWEWQKLEAGLGLDMLVGHTAVAESKASGKVESQGDAEEESGRGGDGGSEDGGEKQHRVFLFGGQDATGMRRRALEVRKVEV